MILCCVHSVLFVYSLVTNVYFSILSFFHCFFCCYTLYFCVYVIPTKQCLKSSAPCRVIDNNERDNNHNEYKWTRQKVPTFSADSCFAMHKNSFWWSKFLTSTHCKDCHLWMLFFPPFFLWSCPMPCCKQYFLNDFDTS